MIITITKIANRTRVSKANKEYKVVAVEGTKYGTNEVWKKDIFANKTELVDMLNEFAPGEVVNFKHKKDGRGFWDLISIDTPTPEELDKAVNPPQDGPPPRRPATSGRGGSSGPKPKAGGMSKAEWAAKDAATKESIARAVAIKLAMDNTKVGTKADALIDHAMEFLPFLMGEDERLFDAPSPESALEPPVE